MQTPPESAPEWTPLSVSKRPEAHRDLPCSPTHWLWGEEDRTELVQGWRGSSLESSGDGSRPWVPLALQQLEKVTPGFPKTRSHRGSRSKGWGWGSGHMSSGGLFTALSTELARGPCRTLKMGPPPPAPPLPPMAGTPSEPRPPQTSPHKPARPPPGTCPSPGPGLATRAQGDQLDPHGGRVWPPGCRETSWTPAEGGPGRVRACVCLQVCSAPHKLVSQDFSTQNTSPRKATGLMSWVCGRSHPTLRAPTLGPAARGLPGRARWAWDGAGDPSASSSRRDEPRAPQCPDHHPGRSLVPTASPSPEVPPQPLP